MDKYFQLKVEEKNYFYVYLLINLAYYYKNTYTYL